MPLISPRAKTFTLNMSVAPRALQMVLAGVLAGALLLPGPALGQSTLPPEEIHGTDGDCEHQDDEEECNPIATVLGVVIAEYVPYLTDGVQINYGQAPGGSVYGGRLEWTLRQSQGRRLLLGVGTWTAPTGMLRPEADGTPRYTGRDGAVALTVGGSVPLRDLGLSAPRSVRGVAEATALIGDPGQELRLSVGPRYRAASGRADVTIDLVIGANLSPQNVAPQVGLRIGGLWD